MYEQILSFSIDTSIPPYRVKTANVAEKSMGDVIRSAGGIMNFKNYAKNHEKKRTFICTV